MGAIGGLLGTAGGVNGTGISGPAGAPIDKAANMDQAGTAYRGVQKGLAGQKELLSALEAQNALSKQTNAYNQGQNIMTQLNHSNIIGNQNQAIANQMALAGQQQGTAQQYQNLANGVGPNPAQAALNNATGQNIASQAAMMAGQRGAGANVGLMARQIGQQGAGIQQQAVGQSAEMQAQQQIAALAGLAAQQQAIGGTNQSVAGMTGAQLGAQQAQQQALAAQSAGMAGNRMAGTTGLSQAQQAEQGQLLGAIGNQNNSAVGMQGNINSANAGMANTTMQGQQEVVGGIEQGIAGIAGLPKAEGGYIEAQKMAGGGELMSPGGPSSSFGQFLNGWSSGQDVGSALSPGFVDMTPGSNPGAEALKKGTSRMFGGPAAPSPGTSTGGFAQLPLEGPALPGAAPQGQMGFMPPAPQYGPAPMSGGGLAHGGGKVKAKSPEQKAEKSGNSYSNDKVPAMLSEGEVVIPRSVMQSKDPVRGAADFVAKVMSKRSK